MSKSIFQVRPRDDGKGWAIDEYDGRGAWQSTYFSHKGKTPINKIEAQRRVFQLRREVINSAPKVEPVNKTRSEGFAVGDRPPFVQLAMRLVCPDDDASWWEVEDIHECDGEICATLRSCDVRRLDHVPCSMIRSEWWLAEEFKPDETAVQE